MDFLLIFFNFLLFFNFFFYFQIKIIFEIFNSSVDYNGLIPFTCSDLFSIKFATVQGKGFLN